MLAIVLAVAAVIAGLDQLIKYFITANMQVNQEITVIDHLFSLKYQNNNGVAFGLFQNHQIFFSIVTGILIGVFIYLIAKKKFTGKLFAVSAMLMIGGGIGNLIDRVFRHSVVDYLSLSFFPPVCNFADYCITVGAVLFIIVMFRQSKSKPNSALADGDSHASDHEDSDEMPVTVPSDSSDDGENNGD